MLRLIRALGLLVAPLAFTLSPGLATAAAQAQAATGAITGLVTDRDSGAPVAGVYITVGYRGLQFATITGADGRYTVSNVPTGQPADVFGFHGGGYRYHNSIYDDGLHIVLHPGQTYVYNFTVYPLNNPAGEPQVTNPSLSPQSAAPGQTVTFGLTASGGAGGLSDEVIAASPTLGRMALLAPAGGNDFQGTLTIPAGTAPGDYPFAFFAASNECYDNHVFSMLTLHVTAQAPVSRFFSQTGFRIDNDAFWNYFNQRGGVPTFGYPTSRPFTFEGFLTQFFQRQVMQQTADGSVRLLNLLDPGLLPYTTFNFSTFPAYDAALVAQLPPPVSPGYSQAVQAYIAASAPERSQGQATRFATTFAASPLLGQYNPAAALGLNRPAVLPHTDMTNAFAPQSAG